MRNNDNKAGEGAAEKDSLLDSRGVGITLVHLCSSFRQQVDMGLRKLGLYAGQEQVLFHLWQEKEMTLSQLGGRLSCSAPTVTNMTQRLERSGFVDRRPDLKDARVVLISLTDQGDALEEPVYDLWRSIEAGMLEGLTGEECLVLKRLLRQVEANVS